MTRFLVGEVVGPSSGFSIEDDAPGLVTSGWDWLSGSGVARRGAVFSDFDKYLSRAR